MIRSLGVIALIFSTTAVSAADNPPAEDAADLLIRAGKLVEANYARKIECPAASNLEYRGYPPFPDAWHKLEEVDFPANQPARDLAHQARTLETANWPGLQLPNPDLRFLNLLRALANELADSALYQHAKGDDAAAIELIRDELHMADLLSKDARYLVNELVAVGIRASALDRLNVIMSGVRLTNDKGDSKALETVVAKELMMQLLAKSETADVIDLVAKSEKALPQKSIDQAKRTEKRVRAEDAMAAMCIACHLFKQEKDRWPADAEELRKEVEHIPLDPFGDGRQEIGFVLVKAGLPSGEDRPLLYSRFNTKDGLFFKTNEPEYSYYILRPKEGGQFRDVSAWIPDPAMKPTTEPVSK